MTLQLTLPRDFIRNGCGSLPGGASLLHCIVQGQLLTESGRVSGHSIPAEDYIMGPVWAMSSETRAADHADACTCEQRGHPSRGSIGKREICASKIETLTLGGGELTYVAVGRHTWGRHRGPQTSFVTLGR